MRTYMLIYKPMSPVAPESIVTSWISAMNLYSAVHKAGNYRAINNVRYELIEVKQDD